MMDPNPIAMMKKLTRVPRGPGISNIGCSVSGVLYASLHLSVSVGWAEVVVEMFCSCSESKNPVWDRALGGFMFVGLG